MAKGPANAPTAAAPSAGRLHGGQQPPPTASALRLDAIRAALVDHNTDAAIGHIRALFLGSPHLEALFYCGVVSEQLGKPGEARSWYEQVRRLDASHKGAQDRLTVVAQAPRVQSQPPQSVVSQSQPSHAAAAAVVPDGLGFYAALKNDTSALSKNAVALIDRLQMTSQPLVSDAPVALMLLLFPLLPISIVFAYSIATDRADRYDFLSAFLITVLPIIVVAIGCIVLRQTTRYELREGLLVITKGLLSKRTVTYELFRVTSSDVYRGPIQRLFGSGTLTLNVEGHDGATKKVRLVGLARGPDLVGLQDDIRNLAQLLRQNPLIKGIIA